MKVNKEKQGRKNKRNGRLFELSVRKDLEKRGWIVCKWSNNVDSVNNSLIPAKHKFNPYNKIMSIGSGFPDFIAYKLKVYNNSPDVYSKVKRKYEIIGVEAKSNGYLDKEERIKVEWLLSNEVFSKILIAKKGKKRGEILYENLNNGR